MFEGHNTITLCKAAVMKMMEDHLNKSLYTPQHDIVVTDVSYDMTKGYATFSIKPKEKEDKE